MRVEADQYRVRPRNKRDAFNLESERLSHSTLWYMNEADAISYAKSLSRVKGCKIDILDQAGENVRTEEFPPGNFAYLASHSHRQADSSSALCIVEQCDGVWRDWKGTFEILALLEVRADCLKRQVMLPFPIY